MAEFLGEKILDTLVGTAFEHFEPGDWALYYIEQYGSIDTEPHKQWLIDQVARILMGTPVQVKLASWDNGCTELRFGTLEPSDAYKFWRVSMAPEYDEGVTP